MKKALCIILALVLIVSASLNPLMLNRVFAASGDVDVEIGEDFFSSDIIQDFELGFLSGYNADSERISRDPDGKGKLYCYGSKALRENGNTYIQMKNTGQWIQYLTNEKETGLLETDGTRYNLTFKYRLYPAIDAKGEQANPTNTVNVTIRSLTDTEPTLRGENGSHDVNGVTLKYDSKNTGWQTVTIYNLFRTDTDGYLRVQVSNGKSDGVYSVIDFDDFVFTKVSKEKYTFADSTPKESVYVSSSGSDDNDGTTSQTSYATLDKALTEVKDGGLVNIVDDTYSLASSFTWNNHNKFVTITGGTLDATALSNSRLVLGDGVNFDNITLKFDANDTLYANGNKLVINENVTLTNAITVYGGSYENKSVYGTDVTIKGGTYKNIYGGSNEATVFGDTNVTVGGTATAEDVYGGGSICTIKGSTNLTFEGNASANYIYGGCEVSGSGVSGGTNVNFKGGTCTGVYGGSKYATQNSGTKVCMTGGTTEEVFGGSKAESLTGDVDVMLTGGTVTRRIYGGCYNDYRSVLLTWLTEYYVTGKVTLSLGENLNVSYSSSEEDRSIYARSRQKNLSNTEVTKIVFLSSEAKNNLEGKLTAQDSTMKNVMKGGVFSSSSGPSAADTIATYTYTADDENDTFSVSGDISATATLSVPDTVEFTGKEVKPAVVTYSNDAIKMPAIDITYTNNQKVGTATVVATINGLSVSKDFEIIDSTKKSAEHYEQADRWYIFSGNADKTNSYYNDIGLKQAKGYAIEESTTVYNEQLGDSTKALKLDTYGQFAATKMAVKPNQYYNLEFYYSADKITSSGIFDYVAVTAPDAKISKDTLKNLAFVGSDIFELNNQDYYSYTVKDSVASPNKQKLENNLGWYKMVLTFYSGENSEVMFSLRSGVIEDTTNNKYYAYIDGISLYQSGVETAYNSKAAIRFAGLTDSGNITTKNGLRIYNSIKTDWLGGIENEIVEYGSIVIREGYMNSKFPEKDAPDLDMLTLKGKGVGQGVAYSKGKGESEYCTVDSPVRETLWEVNKPIFNQKIFTTYVTGIAEDKYDDEHLITSYAITSDGSVYYGAVASVSVFKVAYAIDHDTNTAAAAYKYSKAAFDYFVNSSQETKNNYKNWCEANSLETGNLFLKQLVDFELADITLQASDRMEITTAESYNGTQSKMLHVFRRDYPSGSPTLFNASTTYNDDSDPVFTFKVDPNSVYKVTFYAKVKSDNTLKSPWFGVHASNHSENAGHRPRIANIVGNTKDAWLKYTYYLETKPNQTKFSFTFNAGESTPEAWIDDISVEETDFNVFTGHGEAAEEITINFDDYAVNSEYCERTYVDTAPDKDANLNNRALKFVNKNYGSASFNPDATRKKTDAVLSNIPVKSNTVYKLSYWLYVTKNTGSVSWFKFYYFPEDEEYSNYGIIDPTGMNTRGEWVKFETEFITKPDQQFINFAIDCSANPPEMWLDDISIKEVKAGGVLVDNSATYSEDMYNILGKDTYADVTEELSSANTGAYRVEVSNGTVYTFGVTASGSSSSNSRVFLSFDGVNPMSANDMEALDMVVTPNGEETRYGLQFMSDDSGYVYIVVENGDNTMSLEMPYLFRTYSMSTSRPMGFDKAPDKNLSVNTGRMDNLTVFSSASGVSLLNQKASNGYNLKLLDRKAEDPQIYC